MLTVILSLWDKQTRLPLIDRVALFARYSSKIRNQYVTPGTLGV
jgi:hypothetical protein